MGRRPPVPRSAESLPMDASRSYPGPADTELSLPGACKEQLLPLLMPSPEGVQNGLSFNPQSSCCIPEISQNLFACCFPSCISLFITHILA